jgi:outer membrane protein TolC
VLVDVPLLTRVQDGRFQAAEASMARVSEQARFQKDRIVADVRDATSAVEMARQRLSAVRSEIVASGLLVDAEKQRFDLGEGTLLLVNLREAALAEARAREIDVLSDYHKALASQKAATGVPAPRPATGGT